MNAWTTARCPGHAARSGTESAQTRAEPALADRSCLLSDMILRLQTFSPQHHLRLFIFGTYKFASSPTHDFLPLTHARPARRKHPLEVNCSIQR
jgi:hypothetical protein